MTIRVRYAPSPTGHLHIGGVRTALFNYLFAKRHGGQFILRTEDTDLERNIPGAEDENFRGFHWLGFTWDEGPDIGGSFGPYRCTERLPIYQSYLQRLVSNEIAYPCYCTTTELEHEREQAAQNGQMPRYSGKCRGLTAGDRAKLEAEGRIANWRFAVPANTLLQFTDLIRGEVTFQSDDIGDFVIVKSNGIPTYNFQVVIDDALMQISHVIRGEEHLSNTPRQLLVYRAFEFMEPKFAHLPQVLDKTRKKLSKRDPNVKPVHFYREQGYLPEALVNFLSLLGWSPGGEEEIMSMQEIASKFDLERVSRSGAVFDADKLQWMSQQYLKNADIQVVSEMVKVQVSHQQGMDILADDLWFTEVVRLYQEQMSCAADFIGLSAGFFYEKVDWDAEALEVMHGQKSMEVIGMYLALAENNDEWTVTRSKAHFKEIGQALSVKGKALFMPVRAAATGTIHGPDLQMSITLLPRTWVIERLKKALSTLAHSSN